MLLEEAGEEPAADALILRSSNAHVSSRLSSHAQQGEGGPSYAPLAAGGETPQFLYAIPYVAEPLANGRASRLQSP